MAEKQFKPMLAGTLNEGRVLEFPLLASYKLDGIRAIVRNGVLVSRNLKPIPNKFVQARFARSVLEGLDGELIEGTPNDPQCFSKTTSAVMSIDGAPTNVRFWAFDRVVALPFARRLSSLEQIKGENGVTLVSHEVMSMQAQLDAYESQAVHLGYEGVMLRKIDGYYKNGRSTVKEGLLLKVKRFDDAEAVVIGFEEAMQNNNPASVTLAGLRERSHKKAGMAGKQTLGALIAKGTTGPFKGATFNIGTGFTADERQRIWGTADQWRGVTVKYKFFKLGSRDAPRFPVFLGRLGSWTADLGTRNRAFIVRVNSSRVLGPSIGFVFIR